MPESKPKFYLTTPIYYVNARPHIGHAYSTIAADVIARRHRLLGDDTFFLTGTDEHGQKVQRSAEKAGIPPQQFTDEVSATFRNLWKRMGITNDDYIRTTDERHKRGVQHLWKVLEHRGAIYLSSYTGQYCVSEEMFIDGPPGTIGPDGKPTETVTEENYFFRLSDYQDKLIHLIESGELHIQPDAIKNEVLSFIRGGLKDVSISRTSVSWGIPVPGNEKHTIYVWFDALINYITAVGYGSDDDAEIAKFNRYWPADLHLVGKEITRFHCVYWPAFLMAAGLRLPKAVVANGWLLFEESKMSKSRGNVVRTETILDAFGPLCPPVPIEEKDRSSSGLQPAVSTTKEEGALAPGLAAPTKAQQDLFAADVIRYFLLDEIPFGRDGSFSFDSLIGTYTANLCNAFGNTVSRTLALIQRHRNGVVPNSGWVIEIRAETMRKWGFDSVTDSPLLDDVQEGVITGDLKSKRELSDHHKVSQFELLYTDDFEAMRFSRVLERLHAGLSVVDGILSQEKPWNLIKQNDDASLTRFDDVVYAATDAIRIITALLYPVMPYATASVWRQLGLGSIEEAARNGELKNLQWGGLKPGTKLGPLAPIFPRADKGLAQLMTDMESPATPVTPEPGATPSAATTEAPAATPRTSNLIPSTSAEISIDDFAKIDLRVAQIVVAERIPKADKLLRLEVDLGTERRQILSGIAEFYTPEELIGKRIAIIANLAPRKMRGLESHGMLLAASAEDHSSKPILAIFSDEVPLGSKIR